MGGVRVRSLHFPHCRCKQAIIDQVNQPGAVTLIEVARGTDARKVPTRQSVTKFPSDWRRAISTPSATDHRVKTQIDAPSDRTDSIRA